MSEESPQIESRPMEPKRSGNRRGWLTFALVVLALAVVAGAFVLIRDRAASRADEQLQRALRRIEAADEVVLDVDAELREPVEPGADVPARELIARIPEAQGDLDAARSIVRDASASLPEDRRALADDINEAADAREEMLDEARVLLQSRALAAAAVGPAREGWRSAQRADRLIVDAARRFNEHTTSGVTAAAHLADQARAAVSSATAELRDAEREMPSADVEPFLAYVELKADLVRRGTRVYDLWLAGRVEEANESLGEYNRVERRAAAEAGRLEGTPASAVSRAYDESTEEPAERYFDARDRARQLDERIARAIRRE